jgi:hypothetical protein
MAAILQFTASEEEKVLTKFMQELAQKDQPTAIYIL